VGARLGQENVAALLHQFHGSQFAPHRPQLLGQLGSGQAADGQLARERVQHVVLTKFVANLASKCLQTNNFVFFAHGQPRFCRMRSL
jgi:hypothetical protein